eukprot:COSAG05_NODE_204_length_14187_cov_99.887422_21_plen_77_part_00
MAALTAALGGGGGGGRGHAAATAVTGIGSKPQVSRLSSTAMARPRGRGTVGNHLPVLPSQSAGYLHILEFLNAFDG